MPDYNVSRLLSGVKTDEVLKAIQDNYVGTAEEHALLAELVNAEQREWERVEASHRQQVEDDTRYIEDEKKTLQLLSNGQIIDLAVFHWLACRSRGDSDEYQLDLVVETLAGRGVTTEHLRLIVDRMKTIQAKGEQP